VNYNIKKSFVKLQILAHYGDGKFNTVAMKKYLVDSVSEIRGILIEDAKQRLLRNPSGKKEGTVLKNYLNQDIYFSLVTDNVSRSSFTAGVSYKKFKLSITFSYFNG
jgi:hypothetical protein